MVADINLQKLNRDIKEGGGGRTEAWLLLDILSLISRLILQLRLAHLFEPRALSLSRELNFPSFASRYQVPAKQGKKNHTQLVAFPIGAIPKLFNWSKEKHGVFIDLGVDDVYRDETCLAALISYLLSIFPISIREIGIIRPGTSVMASLIAEEIRACLVVPVLASLYHSLNGIVTSPQPGFSRDSSVVSFDEIGSIYAKRLSLEDRKAELVKEPDQLKVEMQQADTEIYKVNDEMSHNQHLTARLATEQTNLRNTPIVSSKDS
ncbi:hypothetical protein ACH5RR_032872 [Cinchona calisaya]|uniref:Uncharacterized protein n=1 Tax=Cinchona calisaya TaxID=153742 RepID=A0ABD2YNH1_9GENT